MDKRFQEEIILETLKLKPQISFTNLHMVDTQINKIKSQEKLLNTQITRMLSDSSQKVKYNLNDTHFSGRSPKNQTTFEEESEIFTPTNSKTLTNSDLAQKVYVRKLIYDSNKREQEFLQLKKSYDQLEQECKIAKAQYQKLCNFLKQKLLTKLQCSSSQSKQYSPTLSKPSSIKNFTSIKKFKKSSDHHKQKNSIIQYTVEDLIKKVDDEWQKLLRQIKEMKNMQDILGSSIQDQNYEIQQLRQIIEGQKIQIEKLTQENILLSEQIFKQKQKLEIYKKRKYQHDQGENKKICQLEQQNSRFRQEIQILKKNFQIQEQKMQYIIRIASQRSYLSTVNRIK